MIPPVAAHDLIVGLVALQRLLEVVHGRRNARRLLAQGGVETGAGHYPFLVLTHAAWLIAVAVAVPRDASVHGGFLAAYGVLLAARIWVMTSLGEYWTTRVISVPGAPLVRRGPYRHLRHPNYLVVAGEIAVLPLVFGAWEIAAGFSALNGALMVVRIRAEDRALADRRSPGSAR